MRLRILVACKHLPYWGGDSTIGYLLCRQLQALGVDAHYVSLVEEAAYLGLVQRLGSDAVNPRRLPNVHVQPVRSLYEPEPDRLGALVRGIRPDIILAVNIAAAVQLRPAAPETALWFLPSSSFQLKTALSRGIVQSEIDARAAIRSGRTVPRMHDVEARVVADADRIICHSDPMREWFEYFFPERRTKIARTLVAGESLLRWDLRRFQTARRAFHDRRIDLLFVANRWDRLEKNQLLMHDIIARSPDLASHVVGECEPRPTGAIYHQFVRREALIRLMGDAKTLVSPSLYDAAPNVLVEAQAMGCNVVASRNCGNWALCHPALLVEPSSVDAYLERVRRAVDRDYSARLEEPPAASAAQVVVSLAADPSFRT